MLCQGCLKGANHMARIAIDGALGSGFGLIRRRPVAALLWGLVYAVLMAASFGVYGPFYLQLLTQLAAAARPGADLSPQTMNAMMPGMIAMQGWSFLMSFAGAFTGVVIYCAVFRTILHPEQARFGYLRVGPPELLLFVLAIAAYIVFVVAALIVTLVVALLVGGLAVMHAGVAAAILGVLAVISATVAVTWIGLRFSMVGPMMVADGKFHLFESWTLTKGHAGVLFVLAICLFAIVLIAEAVVFGLLALAGAGILGSSAGGLDNLSAYFKRPPSAVLVGIAPVLVLAAAVLTPFFGCLHAIGGAPWARAYLDLTTPPPAAPAVA